MALNNDARFEWRHLHDREMSLSRADARPARVRRASAKTHAPSAKTIAAVDLARVGSGTLSSRPYVHMINNCNVCTYNFILITRAQCDKLFAC